MRENAFDPQELVEQEKKHERPDYLYRGFTVNPETLSLAMFEQPLVPGTRSKDDPTRVADGNELGVYMSTNSNMVEIYASGGTVEGSTIPTLPYNDRGMRTNQVNLPVCGAIMEIDTKGLAIREPKMIKALEGLYNNGFEGAEWIADSVPPQSYKLLKLFLSRHMNDRQKEVFDVSELSDEEKQQVIDQIIAEFRFKKEEALEFKEFLEGLGQAERMNEHKLRRLWAQYKAAQAEESGQAASSDS